MKRFEQAIQHLGFTVFELQKDLRAIERSTELDNANGEFTNRISKEIRAYQEAMDALRILQEVQSIKTTLEESKSFISSIMDLYGSNLQVTNYHLNGEPEPFDCFIEDFSTGKEIEHLTEVITLIDSFNSNIVND